VLNDEQVRARHLFEERDFAGSSRRVPITRSAVRLSESPGELRQSAPALGEHTDEVLSELGFTPDEITTFRREGAI
jgi:crotonobetainyl-CoA:carnitine CoA-transferase CaiB-like acyl-CoA transferase